MTMGARAIFIGTNAIDYSDIRTAVRNFMPPINWLQRGLKAGLKAIPSKSHALIPKPNQIITRNSNRVP